MDRALELGGHRENKSVPKPTLALKRNAASNDVLCKELNPTEAQ